VNFQIFSAFRFSQRQSNGLCWQRLILSACALILAIAPHIGGVAVEAQVDSQVSPPSKSALSESAAVVVDGNPIFEVRNTSSLPAAERAQQINLTLEEEGRSPDLIEIDVVRDGSLVYLKSQNSNKILTTVTEADVADPRLNRYQQARVWAESLERALQRGQLERRPAYLRQAALYSLIVILGAIAVHLGLHVLGRWVSRRLDQWLLHTTSNVREWTRPLKLFWQLGLLGIQVGLWTTVAYTVTDTFPQARSWRYKIFEFLTARIINLGTSNYSALELLLFLMLTVGLWFLVSLITRFFRLYVLRRAGLDRRMQDILGVLVQYALTFLGIIILLQIWGIDVSSLAILASVLGVGLGFGVQNITNNFISGFIITLERPIQLGDFVNVGELVGTVEHIGARSTEIRTLDQVTIIVPNSRFLENEVINWSHGDPVSRLHLPVGVAYGSNIEKVKRALLEAVKRHPEVLLRPHPEVWFHGFGDNALNFELMVWTGEPRKQFKVKSDLYYAIEASLRRYDIEIPFPQRVLHLRSPQLDDLLTVLKHNASQNGAQSSPQQTFQDSERQTAHVSSSQPPEALPQDEEITVIQTDEDFAEHHRPDQADADYVSSEYLNPPSEARPEPFPVETGQRTSSLESLDLEEIAQDMQAESGLSVRDRHYHSNFYPSCFTGTAAVEWLVQERGYSREESLFIGQSLLQQGFIRGLIDDKLFRDGYYFYRFYRQERNSTPSESVL